MQVQKDFVKEEIIRVAKKEFIKSGFQKASLRDIAKEVGATTGIIYTYFKNKDELFEEVVRPVLQFTEHRFKDLDDLDNFKHDLTLGVDIEKEPEFYPFTSLVENFRDELYLLMFRSGGSKKEHFIEDVIERKAKQYYSNLLKMQEDGLSLKMKINPFFLRMPVKLIFTIIGEMVSSNLNKDELISYEKKAMPFLINAWKSIF